MVRITYYADEACLGTYDCPNGSSQEERNAIARKHGINHYTKFILDDGRVIGWVENGQLMRFEYGEDGTNQLNTNTMEENRTNNASGPYSGPGYIRGVDPIGVDPSNMHAQANGMPPIPGTGEPQSLSWRSQRYPLTPNECVKRNKARQIQITQADYGYIVTVGCQTLVFEAMQTMIDNLKTYLKDPDAVEKKWMTEGTL